MRPWSSWMPASKRATSRRPSIASSARLPRRVAKLLRLIDGGPGGSPTRSITLTRVTTSSPSSTLPRAPSSRFSVWSRSPTSTFAGRSSSRPSRARRTEQPKEIEMASDNTVTLVGNITDDPELRFTPNGSAVANFTVAVNRRINKDGQWEDRLDGFFRCNCWRDMAENVAESLQKGMRVVVVGRLQQRSWDDNDGNRRSVFEIQVDEVGPSLRWATAQIQKSRRSSAPGAPGGGDWGQTTSVGAPSE